ncbi:Amino acid permease 6 [Tripterygium wilfordii]|uniref:Amino acid permease 6 n=1 Tax=Tripterygium wilfordii TaxID=458696 RepID=A0A7J7D0G1_TRIWF|nr:Amino acid permease 6 [Tripterygium wilfordii]
MEKESLYVEQDPEVVFEAGTEHLDDDGRPKRTGGRKVQLCGLAQYGNLIGITIGYIITASISMAAVRKSNCFHKEGHHAKCATSNNPYMIIFACIQIVLSQIPDFDKLSWLSIVAAIMSFTYSTIGLALSMAKVAGGAHARTSLTGVTIGVDVSGSEKVFCQPTFSFVEKKCQQHWPENTLITREYALNIPRYGVYHVNFFRLVWRTAYVIVTAVVAMILPFFNDFVGLIGAASFWPLTVYFPIEMYIARSKMKKFSFTWTWLKILSWACLVVSLVAAAGSIQGMVNSLRSYKPFKTQQ